MKIFIITPFVIFFILTCSAIHAQWSPDYNLTPSAFSASINENMASCIAVNKDTVNIVWCDSRTNGNSIFFKRSTDTGSTWTAAKSLTDTNGNATFPAIACTGNILHVVWMDARFGHNASFYKRSLDGGITWSPDYCLDSNTLFWPGIAASGSLVVVSLNKQLTSSNTEVFFRRSTDYGAYWSAEQQISNAAGRSEDPSITTGSGFVHIAWNDNRTGVMETFYRRSADSGQTWGSETQLTFSSTEAYCPMINTFDSNIDLVWADMRSGNFDAYRKYSHDFGTSWSAESQLSSDPANSVYPVLTRDNKNIHIIWWNSQTTIIYHHSDNNGTSWYPDTVIVDASKKAGMSYIVSSGRVLHLIWVDKRNSKGNIYYKHNLAAKPAIYCTVITDAASNINATSATLNGTVNANNTSTIVSFEYGLTKAYGTTVNAVQSPITGLANTAVSFNLTGLNHLTTYYYRVKGNNSSGIIAGFDTFFTTKDTFSSVNNKYNKNFVSIWSYEKKAFIKIISDKPVKGEIYFSDLSGKCLILRNISGNINIIDLKPFANGYYVVKVVTEDNIFTRLVGNN